MNEVVNWFLLLIIFVFDPLAIALVVASNMAFAQLKPKVKEIETYPVDPNPTVPLEELTEEEVTYDGILNNKEIPLYDPYTGELNPYYEELTGKKNPLDFTDEDMSRLTDTTKTLIVENNLSDDEKHIEEAVKSFMEDDLVDEWLEELGKEKGLKSKEKDLPLTKILRYTKRQ
jgi:hypothetical protein